jgi:hypothetical protein
MRFFFARYSSVYAHVCIVRDYVKYNKRESCLVYEKNINRLNKA